MTASNEYYFYIIVCCLPPLSIWAYLYAIRKSISLVFSLFLLYCLVSVTCSVAYLETYKVFVTETQSMSSNVGALGRLFLFNILTVVGFLNASAVCAIPLGLNILRIKFPTRRATQIAIAINIIAMAGSLANLVFARSTALPGLGVSRVMFWSTYAAFPIFSKIFGILMIFVPFEAGALLLYANRTGSTNLKKIAWSFIITYFLVEIAQGQVFHGLLLPATILLGVYAIDRVTRKRPIVTKGIIVLSIVLGIVVSLGVLESFKFRGVSNYAGGAANGVLYRIFVLQGSTHWRSDQFAQQGFHGSLNDVLNGREFLIAQLMPRSLGTTYDEGGINLQGTLSGTLMLALGPAAAAIGSYLYGFLFGVVCSLAAYSVLSGRILLLFPVSYLWLWVLAVYNKGSLETIIDPKFVAFSILVLAWLFLPTATPRWCNHSIRTGPAFRRRVWAQALKSPRDV